MFPKQRTCSRTPKRLRTGSQVTPTRPATPHGGGPTLPRPGNREGNVVVRSPHPQKNGQEGNDRLPSPPHKCCQCSLQKMPARTVQAADRRPGTTTAWGDKNKMQLQQSEGTGRSQELGRPAARRRARRSCRTRVGRAAPNRTAAAAEARGGPRTRTRARPHGGARRRRPRRGPALGVGTWDRAQGRPWPRLARCGAHERTPPAAAGRLGRLTLHFRGGALATEDAATSSATTSGSGKADGPPCVGSLDPRKC